MGSTCRVKNSFLMKFGTNFRNHKKLFTLSIFQKISLCCVNILLSFISRTSSFILWGVVKSYFFCNAYLTLQNIKLLAKYLLTPLYCFAFLQSLPLFLFLICNKRKPKKKRKKTLELSIYNLPFLFLKNTSSVIVFVGCAISSIFLFLL